MATYTENKGMHTIPLLPIRHYIEVKVMPIPI